MEEGKKKQKTMLEVAKEEWAGCMYEKAAKHLIEAAEDDGEANWLLGMCYEEGYLGLKMDPIEARRLFQKSMKLGHGCGLYHEYCCANNNLSPEQRAEWFSKITKCTNKYAKGMYTCSTLGYSYGHALILESAKDENNMIAQILVGDHIRKNSSATGALDWYLRAASQGYASGQRKTAMCFQRLHMFHLAWGWYLKAAKQGDEESALILDTVDFDVFRGRENARHAVRFFLALNKHKRTPIPYDIAKIIAHKIWKTRYSPRWWFFINLSLVTF